MTYGECYATINPIQSNPIQSNPILYKLCLSVAIATVAMVGQSAWACEKPNVSGYDEVECLKEGLAKVRQNGKYGFVDKVGKVVVPFNYTTYYEGFNGDGFATLGRGGGRLFVTKDGREYTYYGDLYENRREVHQIYSNAPSRAGFLDETGKEVIPLIYESAGSFSNGLALVRKDGKWGYIDVNGKTVIGFKYDNARGFENGKAKVSFGDDGKSPYWFYIDKTGKILTTRTSLADFRKKLEQGDDVYYKTNDDFGKGMIFEIKGNLVQVQTKESQCSQRDYKGNCQNYIENQVGKWVKKSEVYPANHFDL